MQMKKKPAAYRPSAVETRRASVGRSAQMSYEMDEKIERDAMKAKMAASKKAAQAAGAKRNAKKTQERGANAGTIGRSRTGGGGGSLARALFGFK